MFAPRTIAALLAFALSLAATPPVAPIANAPQTTTAKSWTASRVNTYLEAARSRTLDGLRERGIVLPPEYLAWVDGNPIVRATVYGCRQDPLPVLLALRALEIDLGEQIVRRDYTQLALAFAMHSSYAAPRKQPSGWNDGDIAKADGVVLPDVTPRAPLTLIIPPDPRVPVDTKDTTRALDQYDHIINFLEEHEGVEVEVSTLELPPLEYDERGIAKPAGQAVPVKKMVTRALVAADVIASASLQVEFNEYMRDHGFAAVSVDCGDQLVSWNSTAAVADPTANANITAAHKLFVEAYCAKGRLPAERDAAPTPSESMAWFIRNDQHAFDDATRKAREWPRFPLNAPWPVLMMLAADDQPLREREAIWAKFRDDGEFRDYGEYTGDIAQQNTIQAARRVSPLAFTYGSIQMMWKDGGVCGTMGNIGARTHRIVGQPASTAGQPGHCAMVVMGCDRKTGAFNCYGGQYATGGDEVTHVHAGWNYDDVGARKPMVFHQSVAWGVNDGFESFLDTLVLARAWNALSPEERARDCVKLLEQGLTRNPFSMVIVEAALASAPDSQAAIAILNAFNKRTSELAKPDAKDAGKKSPYALYFTTVRDLVHARIGLLPAPATPEATEKLLATLERQGCTNGALIARCWKGLGADDEFITRCKTEIANYLASPARTKDKKESQRFTSMVNGWAKSVKGPARKQWAEQLVPCFAEHETLTIRGKDSPDPALAALRKIAGVKPAPKT